MKLSSLITILLLSSSSTVLGQTVTGTGTLNYVPKFTGASVLGNSIIYDNGSKVGIGVINPQSTLQVGLQTALSTPTTNSISLGGTYSPIGGANMKVKVYDDGLNIAGFGVSANQLNYGVWALAADHVFYQGITELMRIKGTGNVGIGVLPGTKLDVQTTIVNDGMNLRYNNTGFSRIFPNSLGAGAYNGLTKAGDAGIIFGGTAASAGTFGFVVSPWANSVSGLRVDNLGNVGIATNNTKGYQLAVNGSAIFTKAVVKLNASWPDYVFDKNYTLLPLAEVEKFLHKNKHLPEVPSADEVIKNGIDLGDNQAILLKKVEELTIYLIEQNKKLEQQGVEINTLKKQINRLQKTK